MSILPSANQIIAVTNGNWTSAETWNTGIVPGTRQNVVIPAGISVTMDAAMAATASPIRSVLVQGTLQFADDADTRLVVDTLVVDSMGTLSIGTNTAAIAAENNAEIIFAGADINVTDDPQLKGRGLLSHGIVNIHGAGKTAFVKAGGNGSVAGFNLELASAPVGWKAGDQVLVTGSEFVNLPGTAGTIQPTSATYATTDEVRTIAQISGTVLTLDAALTSNYHNRPHPGMPVYVANLTRNVILATDPENVGFNYRRGHTMFMTSPNVDVNNAAFVDLGRTDKSFPLTAQFANGPVPGAVAPDPIHTANSPTDSHSNMRGRYPVHFHRIGQEKTTPIIFRNNVILRSPGWGLSLHSSYANITDNVSYDVFASHFVAEDGDERGAFAGNLAVKSIGDTVDEPAYNSAGGRLDSRANAKRYFTPDINTLGAAKNIQDDGQNGHGFWFQSRNLTVNDNIGVSHTHNGFMFFHRHVAPATVPVANLLTLQRDLIEEKKKRWGNTNPVKIPADDVPLTAINRNIAIASKNGFAVVKANNEQGHSVRNMINGTRAYNVKNGIHLEYTGQYTLRDTEVYAMGGQVGSWEGGIRHGANILDVAYIGFKIHGWPYPMENSTNFSGVVNPPAMLFVNGEVKLKGSSVTTPFDPAQHLYVYNTVPRVISYQPTIHKVVEYNANMDIEAAYSPPTPVLTPLSVTITNGWWNTAWRQTGAKTDSAGDAPANSSLNVTSFSSLWPGEVLRTRANMKVNGVYINRSLVNGEVYLNVIDHVTDRTNGNIQSFSVPIKILNGNIGSEW